MKIVGIERDGGNWPKCGKHGVSQAETEYALEHAVVRVRDPNKSEPRFRTAAETQSGRYVFIVYTYRNYESGYFIRPISARYMHQKEIDNYERK